MPQTKTPKAQLDPSLYVQGGTDVAVADGGTGVSTLSGIAKGNGTSPMTPAVAGTDYAAPTSGSSLLSGNGAGGFNNVTIGSGLDLTSGTLSTTSSAISYTLQQYMTITSPALITTYASSPGGFVQVLYSTGEFYSRLYIPRSGTVVYVGVNVVTDTSAGSSETSSISIRQNATTSHLVSSSVATSTINNSIFYSSTTPFSVATGDFICLIWLTPPWVTPPGRVYMSCVVGIQ